MGNELFTVADKTALVTGGSRGIGMMIARAYVEAGMKVYISSRKANVCAEAEASLSKFGTCIALPADLSQLDEVDRLANELKTREPALHVLVNNAGATWGAMVDEFPEKGWDKVMDVNVKAPFFLTQKLLPLLEAAATAGDPARVINIGSIDGLHTSPFENFSYGPSKAALHHLTRNLAKHLAPRNITVNAVAPGLILTNMTGSMVGTDFEKPEVERAPMMRWGKPEEIAPAYLFLASSEASFITGQTLCVDGGASIA